MLLLKHKWKSKTICHRTLDKISNIKFDIDMIRN